MLQSPVQPSNYSLRERRKSDPTRDNNLPDPPGGAILGSGPFVMADVGDDHDDDGSHTGGGGGGGGGGAKGRSKSRRELPSGAVATLKAWLLSPEHFTHPYPTPQDQQMLMQKTGIDKKQLKNWFTNARRRIWKPMLKKQIEQGKLATTGVQPGVPGAVPGLIIPTMAGTPGGPATAPAPSATATASMENPHSIQAMRVHFQQAVQQQQQDQSQQQQQQLQAQQTASTDVYGNQIYAPAPAAEPTTAQYYTSQPVDQQAQQQQQQPGIPTLNSLASLTQQPVNLNKTDSHAVLMELFARDQDLVRQATESARLKTESRQQQQGGQPPQSGSSQHPMKAPTQGLSTVPTLNSWPHFSSITSLNKLGTIPGVKSITSLSGADLAGKGNVNKMANLAQVKSIESMGKNDSYAFLEVFFGDRNSDNNLNSMGGGKEAKGMKASGEEDNEIGLSLEDESPSHAVKKEFPPSSTQQVQQQQQSNVQQQPGPANNNSPAPSSSTGQESAMEAGHLKRAYDDALAARGLISVSRSSEKLTDLVLPAKIQRTLSQEFINKQQAQKQQQQQQPSQTPPPSYGQYGYAPAPAPSADQSSSHQQYPGQQPGEPQGEFVTGSNETDGHVKVSTATTCAICSQTNVDTQLRPCGHMFHERCLKPSLQTPMGQPKCPVDDVPMHSAVLAIPTDEGGTQQKQPEQQQQQSSWNYSLSSHRAVPSESKTS